MTELDRTRGALCNQEVMNYLPHRYPFLMLDCITAREDLHSADGIKQLSGNEAFFQGHLPDQPEMPVSLLLESMAQVGAMSIMATPENQGRYILFASLDNAEFGRPAVPGEQLDISATMVNYRRDMGRTRIVCRVADEEIASADFVFALRDLEQSDQG